jgi:uncharacterized membrane protein YqhA
MNRLEWLFESLLWKSRYVVLMAVVSSLISSFILFFFATGEVLGLFGKIVKKFWSAENKGSGIHFSEGFHNDLVSTVIGAVDDYLLATVLLIFALGLYELFISKIDHAEEDAQTGSRILLIKNLDDLKDRLAKVILMILIVTFFKNVIHATFDQPLQILYLGGGILFVALALYFTHRANISEGH